MTSDPSQTTARADLDGLLMDVKLRVPSFRTTAVSRSALIDQARSNGYRAVGLTAPAGYGKTTLLAEWAQTEDRKVAWLSLDRFDNDPAVLLGALATAYGRIDPENADRVAGIVGLGTSALGRAAPRLAAAFGTSANAFVLMLDDLHEVESDASHDVLGLIIEGVPEGSQVVSGSRFEQPHLTRFRASGDALEFGAADLALDAEGAEQLFSSEEVPLSPDAAVAVVDRTEGWPAGLYLAALIAKEGNGDVGEVAGGDRYVADYLYREALSRQSETVQRFLRRTAVLDQMCASLCEAVAGTKRGADQLRQLEASGLFTLPLDRRREWYRYHALFREFLVRELHRREPAMVEELHLRAARWYEANGSPAVAIENLLLTTEYERTAELLTRMGLPMYSAGKLSTMNRWLAMFGEKNIEQHPTLAALTGLANSLTGDDLSAQRWASFVEHMDPDSNADTPLFGALRALLRGFVCAHGVEAMTADAEFAVAHIDHWNPWRSGVLWLLAEAYRLSGRTDEAAPLHAEASDVAAALGNPNGVVINQSELALLAIARGDWDEASARLDLASATIEERGLQDYSMSPLAFVGNARLALHRGDVDRARIELTRAMRARTAASYTLPFLAVRVRLGLARTYHALGETAVAHHLLHEIDDVLRHRPSLGTLVEEVAQLRRELDAGVDSRTGGVPLTPAELRVLPYLQTHLTLAGIAARLFVSRNTVGTQVSSIYRKLGASSRTEAVEHASAIGLLGG